MLKTEKNTKSSMQYIENTSQEFKQFAKNMTVYADYKYIVAVHIHVL